MADGGLGLRGLAQAESDDQGRNDRPPADEPQNDQDLQTHDAQTSRLLIIFP